MHNINAGHWIKQLRDDLKLSQVALGEMLGVSGAAVSRWEDGSRKPSAPVVRLMEVTFGRSFDTV